MSTIPEKYKGLFLPGQTTKMIDEALKLYGTKEIPGPRHNQTILSWATELGVSDIYKNDETAWCALAMGIIIKRAGKVLPFSSYEVLRAVSYVKFGTHVDTPMFGDVCVFTRPKGYHVFLYVAESTSFYYGLGGNQGNEFNISMLAKDRLYDARRPSYTNQPACVKPIFINEKGIISTDES